MKKNNNNNRSLHLTPAGIIILRVLSFIIAIIAITPLNLRGYLYYYITFFLFFFSFGFRPKNVSVLIRCVFFFFFYYYICLYQTSRSDFRSVAHFRSTWCTRGAFFFFFCLNIRCSFYNRLEKKKT